MIFIFGIYEASSVYEQSAQSWLRGHNYRIFSNKGSPPTPSDSTTAQSVQVNNLLLSAPLD